MVFIKPFFLLSQRRDAGEQKSDAEVELQKSVQRVELLKLNLVDAEKELARVNAYWIAQQTDTDSNSSLQKKCADLHHPVEMIASQLKQERNIDFLISSPCLISTLSWNGVKPNYTSKTWDMLQGERYSRTRVELSNSGLCSDQLQVLLKAWLMTEFLTKRLEKEVQAWEQVRAIASLSLRSFKEIDSDAACAVVDMCWDIVLIGEYRQKDAEELVIEWVCQQLQRLPQAPPWTIHTGPCGAGVVCSTTCHPIVPRVWQRFISR